MGSNLPLSHLLCKRPGCYHSTSKIHVRDRIFKSSPIHASVVISFPEFSSAPFRKNSTVSLSLLHLHKFNLRNNGTQILSLTTHSPFVRKHRKSYVLKENKYSILTTIMILKRCKGNSHFCIEHAQQYHFQVRNKPNLNVPTFEPYNFSFHTY